MAPMAIAASSSTHLSRGLIRMVRELHVSAHAGSVRQRTLLQEMCRLFDANRGSILITAIDADTGQPDVKASLTVEGPFATENGSERAPSGNGARTTTSPMKSRSNGRHGSSADNSTGDGSCHEAFVTLKGIRVARLSLSRSPGSQRFTPTERGLIDVIHSECAWVYDELNGHSHK